MGGQEGELKAVRVMEGGAEEWVMKMQRGREAG